MKFLILEPFYGGSHRAFAEGLRAWSRHSFELSGMPARYWKWRMRGAALHFARAIKNPQQFAGLVVSNLMSLADLKALWGAPCPPAMLYFHENQFSYPLGPGEERDFQYGFTDITSALVADRILFNSHTHHRAFFAALPGFLRMMPEFIPTEFHARVLYSSQDDLVEKLLQGLQNISREDTLRRRLSKAMSPFAWERSIGGYDDKLEELAALKQ